MSILSKSYSGAFYWVAFALSLIVTVLTSDQMVALAWPWLGQVTFIASTALLLVQRLTPIGDTNGGAT